MKKVRLFFTMKPELYEKFQKYIDINMLDQSKVLEKLVEEHLKNNKNLNEK